MSKLHEILAVEKHRTSQADHLLQDAAHKFGKSEYFSGHQKELKLLDDNEANAAVEEAAKDIKALPTTVHETLEYALAAWAQAEDVIYQKNKTNQIANADIIFRDAVIAKSVPVDELMGLEARLTSLRKVMAAMPTLNASRTYEPDNSGRKGAWKDKVVEVTTKTDKKFTPLVLSAATDKHPANVKEAYSDVVVGKFTKMSISGAATTIQKSEVLSSIDDLIAAIRQARMRANSTDLVHDTIGRTIVDILMEPFSR